MPRRKHLDQAHQPLLPVQPQRGPFKDKRSAPMPKPAELDEDAPMGTTAVPEVPEDKRICAECGAMPQHAFIVDENGRRVCARHINFSKFVKREA